MARRRPDLRGWDDSRLREVGTADPRDWVGTVLNALTTDSTELGGGPAGRFHRSWGWGEIREAIRRELVRRGRDEEKAAKYSQILTDRGLKALRDEDALVRRGGRYRLMEEWAFGELARGVIRQGVRAVRARKAGFRVRMEHLRGAGHQMTIEFVPRRGGRAHIKVSFALDTPQLTD
jgi:hypothetical protein